ncbi:S-layer homology domain-containing protein [Bernardetia sp. Wsw4-3y2]|uniref:S-layer homology domain-containing protein n=1 Tax=Bernardetia sp. Wsw4-3y2 TaxID=3127471 RepID=UPI0030D6014C
MKTLNLVLIGIVLLLFGGCSQDEILTENLATNSINHNKQKHSNQNSSDQVMAIMPDVAGNWAETEINYMTSNGYMSGFPDGTFKPNNTITRAEFATMIVGCLNPTPKPENSTITFSDISTHWAKNNILQAAKAGFLSGYPDGTFMPNQNISKLQIVIAISNGLAVSGGNVTNLTTFFTDNAEIPTWAKQSVANALTNRLVLNYPTKTLFTPLKNATRADATALMYCAMKRTNGNLSYTNQYLVNPTSTPPVTGDFSLNYPSPVDAGSPVTFSGTSTGITLLKFFIDGYPLGTTPSNGSYSFTATINNAGIARVLRVEGYNGSTLVKARNQTIDVRQASPFMQNVPYFYQRNNALYPGTSCQNTSIAMVINYYGGSTTPDDITREYGKDRAQTVSGLQAVFNSEAAYFGLNVRVEGKQNGTLAQMETLLDQGKPVIAHGYTTSFGHVLVFLGHDADYYYVHDPYGKWDQVAYSSGYTRGQTIGKATRYRKSAIRAAFSPDGLLWMHRVYSTN